MELQQKSKGESNILGSEAHIVRNLHRLGSPTSLLQEAIYLLSPKYVGCEAEGILDVSVPNLVPKFRDFDEIDHETHFDR